MDSYATVDNVTTHDRYCKNGRAVLGSSVTRPALSNVLVGYIYQNGVGVAIALDDGCPSSPTCTEVNEAVTFLLASIYRYP